MLEKSFGATFFLKTPRTKKDERILYIRITVDGNPREISTKRTWYLSRWDKKKERATGSKEDARLLNQYLETLLNKIMYYRTQLVINEVDITTTLLIDHIKGKTKRSTRVLEEFQKHNNEINSLLVTGEFSKGTHTRYVTARSHIKDYIETKYKKADIEFRELNYEFIKEYELYLKTVRRCSNNTTLKYIANFKKIVLRAIAKEYITVDPFKLFKGKKTKVNKKPLTKQELTLLENKAFDNERLDMVKDIFIFQCYTGLAYSDVSKLKRSNIVQGINDELWIVDQRKKTDSEFSVPLLPKALEIMKKYHKHQECINTNLVLPVRSNQKMNEYLKEIATLCGINSHLNTHKARRTFASTVTLANGVPIHVVKNMLGHSSVKQTEEYALTDQESIAKEMIVLKEKLTKKLE